MLGRNISASWCQIVGGGSAGRNRHLNDTGSLSTRGSATIRAPRHGFVVAPAVKSAHYNANVTARVLGCSNLNLRRCASSFPVPQGFAQIEIEDRELGRGERAHTCSGCSWSGRSHRSRCWRFLPESLARSRFPSPPAHKAHMTSICVRFRPVSS